MKPAAHPTGDPIPVHRPTDDRAFVLRLLLARLLALANTIRTPSALTEAARTTESMREHLRPLQSEGGGSRVPRRG